MSADCGSGIGREGESVCLKSLVGLSRSGLGWDECAERRDVSGGSGPARKYLLLSTFALSAFTGRLGRCSLSGAREAV